MQYALRHEAKVITHILSMSYSLAYGLRPNAPEQSQPSLENGVKPDTDQLFRAADVGPENVRLECSRMCAPDVNPHLAWRSTAG